MNMTAKILPKSFTSIGFTADEDAHVVTIGHQGEVVARFNITRETPTCQMLIDACNEHINKCHMVDFINGRMN